MYGQRLLLNRLSTLIPNSGFSGFGSSIPWRKKAIPAPPRKRNALAGERHEPVANPEYRGALRRDNVVGTPHDARLERRRPDPETTREGRHT